MQVLAIDVFSYDGCDYLTAMDMYSALPFIKALPDGHSRAEVLEAFRQLVSEIGGPGRLLMDRGVEFNSITDFEKSKTAAYHRAMENWNDSTKSLPICRVCTRCRRALQSGTIVRMSSDDYFLGGLSQRHRLWILGRARVR